jgi:hypothetical protein
VKATITNGVIEVDEEAVARGMATVVAREMGMNLRKGIKPDGSGPMPGRRKDGRPRGKGSRIAMAIAPVRVGKGRYTIAAHKEEQGHLARILQEVPFDAPSPEKMQRALNNVVIKAIKLSGNR